jgi:death on curing protein
VTAPLFLTLDEALALHADQIARYGGSLGVRDRGLLESALATPKAAVGGQFLHPTLAEMASAYLFHVVNNRPFVDGNERAGLMCAIAFLGLNDHVLTVKPDALYDMVMSVAAGRADKADVSVFLAAHLGKRRARPAPRHRPRRKR